MSFEDYFACAGYTHSFGSLLYRVALGVGVFDPQDQRAAVLGGDDAVVQRRAGAPHMEVAGRRRREPHAKGPVRESRPALFAEVQAEAPAS